MGTVRGDTGTVRVGWGSLEGVLGQSWPGGTQGQLGGTGILGGGHGDTQGLDGYGGDTARAEETQVGTWPGRGVPHVVQLPVVLVEAGKGHPEPVGTAGGSLGVHCAHSLRVGVDDLGTAWGHVRDSVGASPGPQCVVVPIRTPVSPTPIPKPPYIPYTHPDVPRCPLHPPQCPQMSPTPTPKSLCVPYTHLSAPKCPLHLCRCPHVFPPPISVSPCPFHPSQHPQMPPTSTPMSQRVPYNHPNVPVCVLHPPQCPPYSLHSFTSLTLIPMSLYVPYTPPCPHTPHPTRAPSAQASPSRVLPCYPMSPPRVTCWGWPW